MDEYIVIEPKGRKFKVLRQLSGEEAYKSKVHNVIVLCTKKELKKLSGEVRKYICSSVPVEILAISEDFEDTNFVNAALENGLKFIDVNGLKYKFKIKE